MGLQHCFSPSWLSFFATEHCAEVRKTNLKKVCVTTAYRNECNFLGQPVTNVPPLLLMTNQLLTGCLHQKLIQTMTGKTWATAGRMPMWIAMALTNLVISLMLLAACSPNSDGQGFYSI